MKNRWKKNPKSLGHSVQQPSTWCGRSEQILLNQVGWEARKVPASAGVFFLDFPFYRTYQELVRRNFPDRDLNEAGRGADAAREVKGAVVPVG